MIRDPNQRPDFLPAVVIVAIVFVLVMTVVVPWIGSVERECADQCLQLGVQDTREKCDWQCRGRWGAVW